jgi:hypothetical protein
MVHMSNFVGEPYCQLLFLYHVFPVRFAVPCDIFSPFVKLWLSRWRPRSVSRFMTVKCSRGFLQSLDKFLHLVTNRKLTYKFSLRNSFFNLRLWKSCNEVPLRSISHLVTIFALHLLSYEYALLRPLILIYSIIYNIPSRPSSFD